MRSLSSGFTPAWNASMPSAVGDVLRGSGGVAGGHHDGHAVGVQPVDRVPRWCP